MELTIPRRPTVAERAPWLLLPNVVSSTLVCGHALTPSPHDGIEADGSYACPRCAAIEAEVNGWYATNWQARR
jgi:hypothetical protein